MAFLHDNAALPAVLSPWAAVCEIKERSRVQELVMTWMRYLPGKPRTPQKMLAIKQAVFSESVMDKRGSLVYRTNCA